MKYNYIHVPGCGKPAFVVKSLPVAGEVIHASNLETTKGAEITQWESMICGNCQRYVVTPMLITNLEAQDEDSQTTRK